MASGAANNKGVFVVENCQISPPKGTVPNTSLPLTFFDLPWIHFPHLHALIFYDAPYSRSHFTKTVVPILKTSLSLALKHFFPLAANLILFPSTTTTTTTTTTKPEIRYVDGDSVSLTFAESTEDNIFGYLTGRTPRYVVDFDPFVPQLPPATNEADRVVSPLFAVQITLFPDNGICFGMTMDHVVGDGSTMDGFRRAWALINTKLVSESQVVLPGGGGSVLPFYDRTVIKDPKGLYEILSRQIGNINEPRAIQTSNLLPTPRKMVRASFLVARSDIEGLKKLVMTERTKAVHVSSFVVVCAYVWSCQAKLRVACGDLQEILMHEDDDDDEIEHFLFAVDCRARLDPRVPSTYLGNCIIPCFATTKSKRLKGPWPEGFLTGAELIGEAINGILNNKEEGVLLKGLETSISDIKAKDGERILSVSGSPKFSFHDIDFGWGKPRKFEVNYNAGSMSLNGSKDLEGGLEIGLSLPEDQMEGFASIFAEGLNII